MADLVLNGSIVDGTAAPAFTGWVAVEGDRIVGVGRLEEPAPQASRTIGADGLVVAPGFVDVHNHSDLSPFLLPEMPSTVLQGVTSVVVGNCGSSPWPPATWDEAVGLAYGEPGAIPRPSWSGWRDYLDAIDEAQPAVNLATLVGHGSVRQEVLGLEQRAPSKPELDRMCGLVRESVADGAIGLSTGLIYVPGIFSRTDEVVALAAAAAGGRRAVRVAHPRRGQGPVRGHRRGPRGRGTRRAAGPCEPPEMRVGSGLGERGGAAQHAARRTGRDGRSVPLRGLELLARVALAAMGAGGRHRLGRVGRRCAPACRGGGRGARVPIVGRRRRLGSHRARDGAEAVLERAAPGGGRGGSRPGALRGVRMAARDRSRDQLHRARDGRGGRAGDRGRSGRLRRLRRIGHRPRRPGRRPPGASAGLRHVPSCAGDGTERGCCRSRRWSAR